MRQYLAAAAEGGRIALAEVERISLDIVRVQGLINRTLTAAATVQSGIDGYEGLPTGAQLRQLDWAWEDAAAGVSALNRAIQQDMPALYAAMDGSIKWPEVKPVPIPVRPR
jgi:hypothetical protein